MAGSASGWAGEMTASSSATTAIRRRCESVGATEGSETFSPVVEKCSISAPSPCRSRNCSTSRMVCCSWYPSSGCSQSSETRSRTSGKRRSKVMAGGAPKGRVPRGGDPAVGSAWRVRREDSTSDGRQGRARLCAWSALSCPHSRTPTATASNLRFRPGNRMLATESGKLNRRAGQPHQPVAEPSRAVHGGRHHGRIASPKTCRRTPEPPCCPLPSPCPSAVAGCSS